jgi:hypothetical protein
MNDKVGEVEESQSLSRAVTLHQYSFHEGSSRSDDVKIAPGLWILDSKTELDAMCVLVLFHKFHFPLSYSYVLVLGLASTSLRLGFNLIVSTYQVAG